MRHTLPLALLLLAAAALAGSASAQDGSAASPFLVYPGVPLDARDLSSGYTYYRTVGWLAHRNSYKIKLKVSGQDQLQSPKIYLNMVETPPTLEAHYYEDDFTDEGGGDYTVSVDESDDDPDSAPCFTFGIFISAESARLESGLFTWTYDDTVAGVDSGDVTDLPLSGGVATYLQNQDAFEEGTEEVTVQIVRSSPGGDSTIELHCGFLDDGLLHWPNLPGPDAVYYVTSLHVDSNNSFQQTTIKFPLRRPMCQSGFVFITAYPSDYHFNTGLKIKMTW